MNILVSAGPTRENIDPVRFLTNRSSGKMGYAVAEAAVASGHRVVLVSGPVAIPPPAGLVEFVSVESAADMAREMKAAFPGADAAVLCAAVADFRPVRTASSKIKKGDGGFTLELERTEDIAASLAKLKRAGQRIIGFAAETDELERNALAKLKAKEFDWIAANRVGLPGRGFASDSNEITLYRADGRRFELALKSKKELAAELLSLVLA